MSNMSNTIINFYRTDHRTDGPIRSDPISVLLKSVLGPVLELNRDPIVRTRPFNIPKGIVPFPYVQQIGYEVSGI